MTILTSKNTIAKVAFRRRNRRAYRAALRQIDRATTDLARTPEPAARAAALTRIAELYADLADRHLPAYGVTVDGDGRDTVDALLACEDLARLVAGTESAQAAGAGAPAPSQTPGLRLSLIRDGASVDQAAVLLRMWDDFGACHDRELRAELLECPLYATVLPVVGARAAALLLTIADSEREAARRSYAEPTGRARRRRLVEALPTPELIWGALAMAGAMLTGSVPLALAVVGATAYGVAWAYLGDRFAPACDPAEHWHGPAEHWHDCPGELAEFCPACDPVRVPLVDVDRVRAWLAARRSGLAYQARMLPRRRPRWRSLLRCKVTGHRIGTAGHRRAHTTGPRCRPWWVWWLPPTPISYASGGDAGRPSDWDDVDQAVTDARAGATSKPDAATDFDHRRTADAREGER